MNHYQCTGYSPPLEYPLTQAQINSLQFEEGCKLVDPCPGAEFPETDEPLYPSDRQYVDTELIDTMRMVVARETGEWPHDLFAKLYPIPGDSYANARHTVHMMDNPTYVPGDKVSDNFPYLLQAVGVNSFSDLAYLVSMDDPWDFPLHCLTWMVNNAGIKLRPEHAVPYASLKESKAVPGNQIMHKVLNLRRRIFEEKNRWGVNRVYNYPGLREHWMVAGSDNTHRHGSYPSGHAGMCLAALEIDYYYDIPPEWRVYLAYCLILFSWGRNVKGVHTQQDNLASWKMGGLVDEYWITGTGTREEYIERNPNTWGTSKHLSIGKSDMDLI